MKKILATLLIAAVAVLTVGCLSFAEKQYTWQIQPDGSGKGTIVYRNIFSSGNTDDDYTADDFVQLINDYLEGETLENETPGMRNVKKKLFVEDGFLCGEVTFEFAHFNEVGFYQYKGKGPMMFYLSNSSETFINSSGDWAGEDFPIVFWPEGTKEFNVVTTMGDPYEEGAVSLIPLYEHWEKTGELPDVEEY
ncbi:MAG TPA: hypothetical protein ENN07_02590 [candidate division Zixibacteria bacterium]|nr:hypothetical protein [candidate division Zixibacteria bacterium]